jgi:branched-chain amino acid transport system permease protein
MLGLLLIQRLVQSPFGRALEAIRENEERALMVGYNTNRLQLIMFIFGAALAGAAGALQALAHSFVALESLTWIVSASIVIMTVLGGKGTIVGPFVGAMIYLVLQEYVSRVTGSWQLVVGLVFVALVIFLPEGVWGTCKSWYRTQRAQGMLSRPNNGKGDSSHAG